MTKEKAIFNKNILIAVDDSENSARAVAYTGRILAGGRLACLKGIINDNLGGAIDTTFGASRAGINPAPTKDGQSIAE